MNEKVYCRNCRQWKHGHRVGRIQKKHYEDNLGSEDWIEYKLKIHKHHRGNILCPGSDKIREITREK